MQDLRSLILLALAALVNAQSAPGFPIQDTTNLRAVFQSSGTTVTAGALINQNAVQNEPTIDGPSDATSTIDYMVFMIDQDVTTPSDSTRVQFLHWYQPNLSGASEVLFAGGSDTTNFTSAPALTYFPPTPPGGDTAHKYTIVMYNQPAGFNIPSAFASAFQDKSDLSNRLNFDIAGFVSAADLGQPVGANWFQVQNTTAAATTTTSAAPTTSSTTTTTSAAASSTASTTTFSTTTSSSTTDSTTVVSTTESLSSTSEATSSAEVPSTTLAPAPSTSTFVITASQSFTTVTPSSSPSASAVVTPGSGSGAGMIDVRSSTKVLAISLLLSVAGAGLWLL